MALKSIFAGEWFIPSKIQSDEGFEFGQSAPNSKFVKFLHKNNIIHTTLAVYTPSSQSCIERFNKTLKLMISMGKTANGSEVWFNAIPTYVTNYNNTLHTTVKSKPIDLFRAAATPVNNKAARAQLEGLINTNNCLHPPIQVGDFVRISITKMNANKRSKKIKGFWKSSGINWTKEVKSISLPN